LRFSLVALRSFTFGSFTFTLHVCTIYHTTSRLRSSTLFASFGSHICPTHTGCYPTRLPHGSHVVTFCVVTHVCGFTIVYILAHYHLRLHVLVLPYYTHTTTPRFPFSLHHDYATVAAWFSLHGSRSFVIPRSFVSRTAFHRSHVPLGSLCCCTFRLYTARSLHVVALHCYAWLRFAFYTRLRTHAFAVDFARLFDPARFVYVCVYDIAVYALSLCLYVCSFATARTRLTFCGRTLVARLHLRTHIGCHTFQRIYRLRTVTHTVPHAAPFALHLPQEGGRCRHYAVVANSSSTYVLVVYATFYTTAFVYHTGFIAFSLVWFVLLHTWISGFVLLRLPPFCRIGSLHTVPDHLLYRLPFYVRLRCLRLHVLPHRGSFGTLGWFVLRILRFALRTYTHTAHTVCGLLDLISTRFTADLSCVARFFFFARVATTLRVVAHAVGISHAVFSRFVLCPTHHTHHCPAQPVFLRISGRTRYAHTFTVRVAVAHATRTRSLINARLPPPHFCGLRISGSRPGRTPAFTGCGAWNARLHA